MTEVKYEFKRLGPWRLSEKGVRYPLSVGKFVEYYCDRYTCEIRIEGQEESTHTEIFTIEDDRLLTSFQVISEAYEYSGHSVGRMCPIHTSPQLMKGDSYLGFFDHYALLQGFSISGAYTRDTTILPITFPNRSEKTMVWDFKEKPIPFVEGDKLKFYNYARVIRVDPATAVTGFFFNYILYYLEEV